MSMPTEQEVYDFLYARISGNGSVRFDSDAMADDEPWVRWMARAVRRFLSTRQLDIENSVMALADDADQRHQDGDTRPDWKWVANTLRKTVENAETV